MPSCADSGKDTPADQAAMTADGPICKACHDERLVQAQEVRVRATKALGRHDPENAFGDATSQGRGGLFAVSLGRLLVLHAMKLANVL